MVLATRVLNEERNSLQLFYGAEWPRMQAYVEKAMRAGLGQALDFPLVRDWVPPGSMYRGDYNQLRPTTLFLAHYVHRVRNACSRVKRFFMETKLKLSPISLIVL